MDSNNVWERRYRHALTLIDMAHEDEEGMTGVAFSLHVPLEMLDKSPSELADLICRNTTDREDSGESA